MLYVSNLKSNLLSVGQLQKQGYTININKGACEIYDPIKGVIVIVKVRSNGLFPLNILSIQFSSMTKGKDPSWLWHYFNGNFNFGGLKTFKLKEMVTSLLQTIVFFSICEECVVREQYNSQFPSGKSWRVINDLELVSLDLCSPIKPLSNEGKRYLIIFIMMIILEKYEFISFIGKIKNLWCI